jgi:hypothetical protein
MAKRGNNRQIVATSSEKPKPKGKRPGPGTNHPAPFDSALWKHLDDIKRMRLGRKTWVQIAQHLATVGVTVHPVTVFRFIQRVSRRKSLPLGYQPIETPLMQTPPPKPEPGYKPGDRYRKKLEEKPPTRAARLFTEDNII